ncbi:MAG: cytochrome c biogenesis protein [Chloroflexi bacterium]|nr:cytochrome c biogenesis protein [Chloroflexota bacterium]MCL5075368.1 cytochrome c biogenesis protein [Chloroflexota bacterium]
MEQLSLILFVAGVLAYSLSTLFYEWFLGFRSRRIGEWATRLLLIAWGIHSLAIASRYLASGQLPLASRYETLSFYTWLIVLAYLIVERIYAQKVLGAFITPIVVLIISMAAFLPKGTVASLSGFQSVWLAVHVSLSYIAYTLFTLAFITAIVYLLQQAQLKGKKPRLLYYRLPPLEMMERLGHSFIGLGLPFMALAIITGAFWAQRVWGTFWSWEPKQTATLVALLVYVGYFYMRDIVGWRGKKAAYLIMIGFACILVSYLGPNLMAASRHGFIF